MAEIGVLQGKTEVQLQSYKELNCMQRGDGTSTSYLFSGHISLGLRENVSCTSCLWLWYCSSASHDSQLFAISN